MSQSQSGSIEQSAIRYINFGKKLRKVTGSHQTIRINKTAIYRGAIMEIHLRRGASLELLGNTGECIESYFEYA